MDCAVKDKMADFKSEILIQRILLQTKRDDAQLLLKDVLALVDDDKEIQQIIKEKMLGKLPKSAEELSALGKLSVYVDFMIGNKDQTSDAEYYFQLSQKVNFYQSFIALYFADNLLCLDYEIMNEEELGLYHKSVASSIQVIDKHFAGKAKLLDAIKELFKKI